jgi:E3 ubiquitin-protein ligase TRIP12
VLNTMGRTYVIDFNSMLQINEEDGTGRPVNRKLLANVVPPSPGASATNATTSSSSTTITSNTTNAASSVGVVETTSAVDCRLKNLSQKPHLYAEFIHSLFPIVYEVYIYLKFYIEKLFVKF